MLTAVDHFYLGFKSVAVTSSMLSNPYYIQFLVLYCSMSSYSEAPTLLKQSLSPLTVLSISGNDQKFIQTLAADVSQQKQLDSPAEAVASAEERTLTD